uniref:Uncharacterized protein n=1 Tax=Ananas comosus var. bracteatus TaxID=296719 RepID=A0A6V7PL78_ANACO|nr:unnamed protein product [Ananas comosus var. bracteatus]
MWVGTAVPTPGLEQANPQACTGGISGKYLLFLSPVVAFFSISVSPNPARFSFVAFFSIYGTPTPSFVSSLSSPSLQTISASPASPSLETLRSENPRGQGSLSLPSSPSKEPAGPYSSLRSLDLVPDPNTGIRPFLGAIIAVAFAFLCAICASLPPPSFVRSEPSSPPPSSVRSVLWAPPPSSVRSLLWAPQPSSVRSLRWWLTPSCVRSVLWAAAYLCAICAFGAAAFLYAICALAAAYLCAICAFGAAAFLCAICALATAYLCGICALAAAAFLCAICSLGAAVFLCAICACDATSFLCAICSLGVAAFLCVICAFGTVAFLCAISTLVAATSLCAISALVGAAIMLPQPLAEPNIRGFGSTSLFLISSSVLLSASSVEGKMRPGKRLSSKSFVNQGMGVDNNRIHSGDIGGSSRGRNQTYTRTANWTDHLDSILLSIMMEEHALGNNDNPALVKFKDKPFPAYNDIAFLSGSITATGQLIAHTHLLLVRTIPSQVCVMLNVEKNLMCTACGIMHDFIIAALMGAPLYRSVFSSTTLANIMSLLDDDDNYWDQVYVILFGQNFRTFSNSLHKRQCRTRPFTGHQIICDILNGHPDKGYDHFRMTTTTFVTLRDMLVARG